MKKVAIIGCGISGLYFANLLQKNLEYDYTIFEKRPKLDCEDGYGIQLSVNSIRFLNKIGFQNLNLANQFNPKKIDFYSSKKGFYEIDGSLDIKQITNKIDDILKV